MGKLAIVLAGGGSRGAYQIGVWRALREMGIDYQIVTGASVGALNGAMMVQGDYNLAAEMWETILTGDIVDFDIPPEIADYGKAGWELDVWMAFVRKAVATGGADFTPLEKTIARVVDEARVRASAVDFGLVTVEFPSMKAAELTTSQIPEGELRDFLLASAACFPAFKSKRIGDACYIDGGYHDNMPVNLAISMGAGEVLAVDLEGPGLIHKPKTYQVPVRYIRSYWSLGPFLWFEPALSKRNMALGYLDARRAYGLAEGTAYSFELGTSSLLKEQLLGPARRLIERVRLWSEQESAAAVVRNQAMQHAVRFRFQRILRRRRGGLRSAEEFLLAAAETAGEQLELDPTVPYTLESFHDALLAAFAPVEGIAAETMERLRRERVPVRNLVDRVLREGRFQAVSLCYGELRRAVSDETLPVRLWNLCTLAPEAFLAAVYLYLVQTYRGRLRISDKEAAGLEPV